MSNCSAASFSFNSTLVSSFPLLSLLFNSFFSSPSFSFFTPLSFDSLFFLLLLLLSFLLFFFLSLFSLLSLPLETLSFESLSLPSLSLVFFFVPLLVGVVPLLVGLLFVSAFLSSSLSLSSSENLSCFHSCSGGPDRGINPGLYRPVTDV